jgi:hypothetical protein
MQNMKKQKCKDNSSKEKSSQERQDTSSNGKSSKKGKIKPNPDGLHTIVPRTKRFAYHCAENQTVRVPLCQTSSFVICCIGI